MFQSSPLMADALRLTRSGNLQEATRLIQKSLSGDVGEAPHTDVPGASQTNAGHVRPPIALLGLALEPPQPATRSASANSHGVFEERHFAGAEGKMSYMLYRPSGVNEAMPLVIMLHGCTQGPEDFARGTGMNKLADEMGLIVAYPRQTSAANMQRCWNWFKPSDQQRDKGEPALIAAVTRQIASECQADPGRIYVAGLSAGGAAAAIMGAAYPDVYAAIGVHSGLACGAASDMASAFAAMRSGPTRSKHRDTRMPFVPVITFHGDRDTTVAETNSAHIVDGAAQQSGLALTNIIESGGAVGERKYTREMSCAPDGSVMIERWTIHGAGHAWAGGDASGSYTDASGPSASQAMIAFFLRHSLTRGNLKV